MPLTHDERRFLDAYVYEATHGPPFGGPATRNLGQRNIWYSDLGWILTAYQRELSAEGKPATGILNPEPPPVPWESLDQVRLRSQALRAELEVPEEAAPSAKGEELFDLEEAERALADPHPGSTYAEMMERIRSLEKKK